MTTGTDLQQEYKPNNPNKKRERSGRMLANTAQFEEGTCDTQGGSSG